MLQQSLCSEMLDELRFAVRCHGSSKKPALRRHCTKCARYCPSEHCAVESPNGIILKELEHRSPTLNHRHHRDTASFRYNYDDVAYSDYREHLNRSQNKTWHRHTSRLRGCANCWKSGCKLNPRKPGVNPFLSTECKALVRILLSSGGCFLDNAVARYTPVGRSTIARNWCVWTLWCVCEWTMMLLWWYVYVLYSVCCVVGTGTVLIWCWSSYESWRYICCFIL